MDAKTPMPKPGEYWHRADGDKNGVTILAVEDANDGPPPTVWVTYRYNTGESHTKNWGGFYARFYNKKHNHTGSRG